MICRQMKKILIILTALPLLWSCSKSMTIEVSNPVEMDRQYEIVEVSLCSISKGLDLDGNEMIIITDKDGCEIPYQITSDSTVIFPVCLEGKESARFHVRKGQPVENIVKACGRQVPLKDNDIAWENDLVGFRMYGHDLDVASGYDLFAKRGTDLPVLETFYANEIYTSKAWERYNELMEIDEDAAFRFKMDTLSYHVDRGNGMDCYGVGPTLGAGVAALRENGNIIYPYCYDSFEILDNGPLRFRIRLTFRPFSIGDDHNVIETRIITLDVGSYLNRTQVSYENLTSTKDIVAGIVLQDKDGLEKTDAEKGYIAYPAPTINVDTTKDVDNGTLFVGHVYPGILKEAGTVYFSDEESASRNNTKGHVLASADYIPDTQFTYYWGFGWNHSDMASYEEWVAYLEAFASSVKNPLTVTVK